MLSLSRRAEHTLPSPALQRLQPPHFAAVLGGFRRDKSARQAETAPHLYPLQHIPRLPFFASHTPSRDPARLATVARRPPLHPPTALFARTPLPLSFLNTLCCRSLQQPSPSRPGADSTPRARLSRRTSILSLAQQQHSHSPIPEHFSIFYQHHPLSTGWTPDSANSPSSPQSHSLDAYPHSPDSYHHAPSAKTINYPLVIPSRHDRPATQIPANTLTTA